MFRSVPGPDEDLMSFDTKKKSIVIRGHRPLDVLKRSNENISSLNIAKTGERATLSFVYKLTDGDLPLDGCGHVREVVLCLSTCLQENPTDGCTDGNL